jgi:hypothetical protein
MEPWQPHWITIAGVFGLGAVVGNVVSHFLTSRWQHQVWIKDNKKSEWRELLDAVNKSMEGMQPAFEQRPDLASKSIQIGSNVMMDRIFIAGVLKKSGILDKWWGLVAYVSSVDSPRDPNQQGGLPTKVGYLARSNAFRGEIIRVSRQDLGIDSKRARYKFW